MNDTTLLLRQLTREKKARQEAEAIAEQKSLELYNRNLELYNRNLELQATLEKVKEAY